MIQLPPLPPNSLEGQVVLVTGAYGGLGEAVCRAVAVAGATAASVLLTDSSKPTTHPPRPFMRIIGFLRRSPKPAHTILYLR